MKVLYVHLPTCYNSPEFLVRRCALYYKFPTMPILIMQLMNYIKRVVFHQ
jgi:hypothetical protein